MDPNQISIDRYRNKAAGYDASAEFTMPLRRRTIALLQLQPGQSVIDVGSGTGLSYALLREGVGESGQVWGFEQSPDMFAVAEQRLQREAWPNVWHVNQPAETVAAARPRRRRAVQLHPRHLPHARCRGQHPAAGQAGWPRGHGRHQVFPLVDRAAQPAAPG